MSSGLFETLVGWTGSIALLTSGGYAVAVEPVGQSAPMYAPIVSHCGAEEYITAEMALEDVDWRTAKYPPIEVDYVVDTTTEVSYYYESTMSEAEAKEWIAQRESGGSYESTNGRYLGRYQLNSDWFSDVDRDWLLYTDDGHAYQEERIEEYVAGRYGSWSAAQEFWQNNGWY